ncbi:uncharacterized protein [Euwallacea similis]|uniref:uncharacterized protein n=1 Tax=Euwallacea similis TaxID=1736056 RepID=UPI0034503063
MHEINKKEEKNRPPYSLKEDQKILRYILDGNYQDLIKGDGLWKKMEMERICDFRSWQSMKNRFMRNILVSKNRPEYGLTHEEKLSLRNINQLMAIPNSKKNCVSVSRCDSPLVVNRSDTQEDRSAKSVSIPRNIRNNLIYSVEEDKKLINHLLHNCTFLQETPYENDGWKTLEAENVCSGRSWQSMKNRFLRDIYPSIINPIYNLTEEEIAWITNCLSSKPDSESNKHSSFVEILSSSDESLDASHIESDANARLGSKQSHETKASSTSSTQFCKKSPHALHNAKVLNPFAKSASTSLKKSQRNPLAKKVKVKNKDNGSQKKLKSIHVASSSKSWEPVDSLVTPSGTNDYVECKKEVEVSGVSSSDSDECNEIPNDFYSIDMKWTDSDTS